MDSGLRLKVGDRVKMINLGVFVECKHQGLVAGNLATVVWANPNERDSRDMTHGASRYDVRIQPDLEEEFNAEEFKDYYDYGWWFMEENLEKVEENEQ